MLHTLEKGEYPKGHRYWSNATGDLNAALEDLPVQLRRVLDELWSDGTVVEFCLGIACIVIATVSLYIAGMLRDRRIQAEFARRHAERERRRAERENRGW